MQPTGLNPVHYMYPLLTIKFMYFVLFVIHPLTP
jgi:hypothetical protein